MSGIGAFCGFLFIFIFILISPLILIRSKKAENGEVKDHPRDFHFEENSPKGIHPFPGKSNTLSFVVSVILVDLLGLVICLIFFFFLDKKHEIFIQLEKSYNRESIQPLGEKHKQLHTTLHNGPESPATFLSLHINIFVISFLGL